MLVFQNFSQDSQLFFTGFEEKEIEGAKFLKINVLERVSNTTFSIYEKFDTTNYNFLSNLGVFQNISDLIFVVYKNGRLKFALKLN